MTRNGFNLPTSPLYYTGYSNPSAGANLSIPPPTNASGSIIALHFSLTTDANTANRVIRFYWREAAQNVLLGAASAAQIASETHQYVFAVGIDEYSQTDNNLHFIPIPPEIYIQGAHRYVTDILNIQVGDAITNAHSVLKVWPLPVT